MEKVGELGVVDVIEEGRIGDDEIDAPIWKSRVGRVATRNVNRPPCKSAVDGPAIFDPSAEGRSAGAAPGAGDAIDLRGRKPVIDRPQQTAAEEVGKRAGTLGRSPDVGFDRGSLRLEDVVRKHMADRTRALSLV